MSPVANSYEQFNDFPVPVGPTQNAIEEIEIKDKDNLDLSFFVEVCFKNLLSIIFDQFRIFIKILPMKPIISLSI